MKLREVIFEEEDKPKCDNCGQAHPTFLNIFGRFCNFSCFLQWKRKKEGVIPAT